MFVWCLLVLWACGVRAQNEVSVVLLELEYGREYSLTVNRSVEYLIEFVPSAAPAERAWPSRVWARSDAGDVTRPVLLTARQRSGAVSWQLPYYHEERLLHELQRTLCPDDAGGDSAACDRCDGEEAGGRRGGFSLHVGSTGAAPAALALRADLAADFALAFEQDTTFDLTQAAPSVAHYRWRAGQDSVRLEARAADAACATVSVQNYTCPIAQTMDVIETRGLRMTVERSGAVHLQRASYPYGFVVVTVVRGSDVPCRGEPAHAQDWLWEAAVWGARERRHRAPHSKRVTLAVRAALSRWQYALAAAAVLALFLLFYVAFGALLLARRWGPLARRIGSRAVLADPHGDAATRGVTDGGQQAPGEESALPEAGARRRRGSDATFDSSDNSDSDSDSEPEPLSRVVTPPAAAPSPAPAAPPADATTPRSAAAMPDAAPTPLGANGVPEVIGDGVTETDQQIGSRSRPFGLPAQLRVAALARRRMRVLSARSDRYLHTLYIVAVFYALPVLQFVAAFQMIMNVSGSLDICYYNFLCAHPAGALSDLNHVLSNLGYLLLGALLMLQLRARRRRRRRAPRHEEYGIPAHHGLLGALGAGMMVVALLSASYHVCPNRLNFQFDVAFMYVLAVLSMVKIYQARHPDVNARAHATFGVLAALIALVVWGVLGGSALFWGAATVLHVFAGLLLSLRIYYVGQFRLEKASLAVAARGLRARPLYAARLVMLLITNAINWAFALYGLFTQTADFASHLLNVLLANALVYMLFYLVMKLLHGERPRWYAWCYLGGAVAAWAPALYFFTSGSTDWAATPAQSRHLNHECKVLQFYDSHDLWHLLSAAALYLSFAALMTWDDGLSAVKRTEIAVF